MPSPVRVLHLITGLESGGAERQLALLVRRADPARLDQAVISLTGEGVYGAEIRAAGIELVTLGARRGRISPFVFARLVAAIRHRRPDLLQTWLYHADLAGTLAAPLARRPLLLWSLRNSALDGARYPALTRLVLSLLARLSTRPACILANAEAGLAAHQALGYRPSRSRVIANGIDTALFRPDPAARAAIRAELGAGPDEILVGCIARADPMKDHAGLIAGFAPLAGRARLVLAGAGIEAGSPLLAAPLAAAALGARVMLLGERRDVPRLLNALDLFVLGSGFGEGFSNALAEAMACGLPAVATDTGDSAAILDDCGILVPPREPAALGAALARLIDMPAEARAGLGRRARERIAARYSVEAMVEAYSVLYEELAGVPEAANADASGSDAWGT